MAKDETLESLDDIIDLVDIVQSSDKSESQDSEKVDFDTQLSDILSNDDPISLEDIPDLDELFAEDSEEVKEENNSQQIDIDSEDLLDNLTEGEEKVETNVLSKIDSAPEDLDALLDNLFSEEEKEPIKNQKESSNASLNLGQLEFSTNEDKTNFLEKALDGLDDLDDLLMEEDLDPTVDISPKKVVNVVEQEDSPNQLEDIDKTVSDDVVEDIILSDKDKGEVEAILDAVEDPAFLANEKNLLDSSNVSQSLSAASSEEIQLSSNDSKVIETATRKVQSSDTNLEVSNVLPSVTNTVIDDLNVRIQQLENESQALKQRISALELIIMDHESEVEELQDSNVMRFNSIDEKIDKSLQMDILVKEVVDRLHPEIDKFAAEAAVRVIREEIELLLKK